MKQECLQNYSFRFTIYKLMPDWVQASIWHLTLFTSTSIGSFLPVHYSLSSMIVSYAVLNARCSTKTPKKRSLILTPGVFLIFVYRRSDILNEINLLSTDVVICNWQSCTAFFCVFHVSFIIVLKFVSYWG